MDRQEQVRRYEVLKSLHEQDSTFVLPNAWDVGSAKIIEKNGFKALGTTSAGIAMALGYADGQNIPFEEMLTVVEAIVKAIDIPVSADIEAGYGSTVEEVVENVRKLILAGVVGINLEDATGDPDEPVIDASLHAEKVMAIKKLAAELDLPLFVNARTDLYWLNIGELADRPVATIERAHAYEAAGADCIFIPGLQDKDTIIKVRQAITRPINLLLGPALPSLAELTEIGIERVSTGSAPYRSAMTWLNLMSADAADGNFKKMTDSVISYADISKILY